MEKKNYAFAWLVGAACLGFIIKDIFILYKYGDYLPLLEMVGTTTGLAIVVYLYYRDKNKSRDQ